jgi:hypothetical protein
MLSRDDTDLRKFIGHKTLLMKVSHPGGAVSRLLVDNNIAIVRREVVCFWLKQDSARENSVQEEIVLNALIERLIIDC